MGRLPWTVILLVQRWWYLRLEVEDGDEKDDDGDSHGNDNIDGHFFGKQAVLTFGIIIIADTAILSMLVLYKTSHLSIQSNAILLHL